MKSFKNKVVVVTGGSNGIGNSLVKAFAAAGAHIAFCDIADVERTKAELETYSIKTYGETVDIADSKAIKIFAANVITHFGHADILVNNAGIISGNRNFEDINEEEFNRITNINYFGVVRTTMAFYQHLLTRPEAAIVNLSSTSGLMALPFIVPYSTTKFAIRGFSNSLRAEHKLRKIKNVFVHTVLPGPVATDICLRGDYIDDLNIQLHKLMQVNGISPEKVATLILRGIRKRKGRILIGTGRKVDVFTRLFPNNYWYLNYLYNKLLKLK